MPAGVTTPDEEPMLATLVLPLTHVPPVVASASVVVALAQTVVVPVMIAGNGLMEITAVVKQPPGRVYVRFAVPAVPPVMIPVLLPTVAVPVPALVLHVPPPTELVAVTVAALQTSSVPPIAYGVALTVTAETPVQPVAAV